VLSAVAPASPTRTGVAPPPLLLVGVSVSLCEAGTDTTGAGAVVAGVGSAVVVVGLAARRWSAVGWSSAEFRSARSRSR
jgi:hypothetical protein